MSSYRVDFFEEVLYSLLCIAFVVGQRELDITVYGDKIVKTNIATYTIYDTGGENFKTTLTVSCTFFGVNSPSVGEVNSTLGIERNGIMLNKARLHSLNTHTVVARVYYEHSNVSYSGGNYSCRFHTFPNNESSFMYNLESEIHVETTEKSIICASSIGFYGYVGEKVTLFCEDDTKLKLADFSLWRLQYHLHSTLVKNSTSFKCVQYTSSGTLDTFCSSEFTVERSLKIELSPTKFSTESINLTFDCRCTPPRFLFWEIIENDGKILNLNNLNYTSLAYGNVAIAQMVGWSSLQISGIAVKKVEKIVCATYGTRIQKKSFATLIPNSYDDISVPYNRSESRHTTSGRTTPQPYTDAAENNGKSGTDAGITSKYFNNKTGTTGAIADVVSLHATTLFRYIGSCEHENDSNILMIMIAAIACFEAFLLFIVMIGLWFYCRYFAGRKTEPTKANSTRESGVNIFPLQNCNSLFPSETEMKVNEVYEPYQ